MELDLKKLKDQAMAEFKKSKTLADLDKLETKYLGRKGELSAILRKVKDLTGEAKPKIGQLANQIKLELEKIVAELRHEFGHLADKAKPAHYLDITLPGQKPALGHLHPITIITRQLEEVFVKMGFMVLEGPELESEYYNFESLNIPATHPARDIQDTFYIKDQPGWLLRTQTSNQQVRTMEKYGAPLRAIFPGRVFRCEATDVRHETTFYQLEGLMIDKDISIAHLVTALKVMLKGIFKKDVKVRLRPGYFPFVEPGFEVDVSCLLCDGEGCGLCKKTGWVEMIGAGLVHPKVLQAGGLDPKIWSGFAFGMGINRLVMLKYGIDDIRLFMSGDLRFLEQF
ncbi:MAG: phenylalanine--tRNA ligase subunit alpha [Candidatus Komeilibacteria bacterium]|nr:phenylalanine--tRNA ligase subunit alpha [Candidatus Komeilibacteria bacterium]